MAENFNTFFCSIIRSLATKSNSSTKISKYYKKSVFTHRAYASIFLEPVDKAEVVQTINSLNF